MTNNDGDNSNNNTNDTLKLLQAAADRLDKGARIPAPYPTTDKRQYAPIVAGTAMREQGKIAYHLVPPEFNAQLALVCTIGAQKYAPMNFEKGLPIDDLIRAIESHLVKLKAGELYDIESKQLHTAHIAWNALVFGMQMMRAPELAYLFETGYAKRRAGNYQHIADAFAKEYSIPTTTIQQNQPTFEQAVDAMFKAAGEQQ